MARTRNRHPHLAQIVTLSVAITLLVAIAARPQPVQAGPGIPLRLAWATFDPLDGEPWPPLPKELRSSTPSRQGLGRPNYYIAQFDSPIEPADRAALSDLGADVQAYVPDFGFVLRMNGATAARVGARPGVRWVGHLQPGFRLAPDLIVNHVQNQHHALLILDIVVFAGEDPEVVAQRVETLGGHVLSRTTSAWQSKVRVTIDSKHVVALARLPQVSWIERSPTFELTNEVAARLIGVAPVRRDHGLYGAGQVVAVCDTGLDQGFMDAARLHDDFEDGDGRSRVVVLQDRVGDGAEDANSGHGTHVAGSILGNGVNSGTDPVRHSYPGTAYVGMAPEARLVMQAVETDTGSLYGIPDDLKPLFQDAYDAGARLHNNSWGDTSVHGVYTTYAQDVDEFTWDHPDFLPIFAAGNSGVDADGDGVVDLGSVVPPGTAKNSLTVGATENLRSAFTYTWSGFGFTQSPISEDSLSDDANGMAAFSSRGPVLDGRTKPDIVGPGTFVASTRSSVASGTGWGAIDASYMYNGGTSMATPLVTGAAALVRDYFERREGYAPSAALVKATLINGATDIYPGQYGTDATQEITRTRPSMQAGWGRANVAAALFPNGRRRAWYWDTSADLVSSQNLLTTGEAAAYTVDITEAAPLSITLAWTDYPGSPMAQGGLVNDLDLMVDGPGGFRAYPNHAVDRSTYGLAYDDGAPNGAEALSAGEQAAVRFTVADDAAIVDQAVLHLWRAPEASGAASFDVRLYDGLAGPRCATTTSVDLVGSSYDRHVVDLSAVCSKDNRTITTGDFYISIRIVNDNDPQIAYDTDAPIDGRSWFYDGSVWTEVTEDRDYMIGAVLSHPATTFDRTNNVVGIDIPAPKPGLYTVTVRGYNIPFGPQPYAMVLSGVGRLLGSETVTRTIKGAGTYGFANADAVLDFSEESLDTVSVTVHRDTPTGLPRPVGSLRSVDRTFEIHGAGGTGAFNAALTLSYDDAELNGIAEGELFVYRWQGGDLGWERYIPVRDHEANTLTVTGVTDFSTWIIAEGPTPTPVGITTLDAHDGTPSGVFVPLIWVVLSRVAEVVRRRERV